MFAARRLDAWLVSVRASCVRCTLLRWTIGFFGCRGHEPERCMLDMLRTRGKGVTAGGDKN